MAIHEGLVLKTLDENIRRDPDQWPEFSLKNISITSQTTGEPTSILKAHKGAPLRVEGILEEVDSAYIGLVKKPNYQNQAIAIDNVSTYSFSQYEDGTFGFWAGGEAGWFEVTSPTRAYQHIFQEVNEAIGMFYFLADKYRKTRKRFVGASAKSCEKCVKSWFNEYFNSDCCTRDDVDDVREGFHQHRYFLIKSMFEGQEGLDWKASPIWRHFKLNFPDEFTIIEAIVLEEQAHNHDSDVEIIENASVTLTKSIANEKGTGLSFNQESANQHEDAISINDTSAEDEPKDEALVMNNNTRPKRKSGLRPKGNKSSKATARKQSLRFTIPNKDTYIDLAEDTASAMDVDEFPSINTQQRDSSPTIQLTKDRQTTALRGLQRTESRTMQNPLPSYYEPRGHGDTWSCPYDGCNRLVWNARDAESIEMIKLHFVEFHANNAEDLINQESRPWVSVDHLLDRVKGIASLQAQAGPQQAGFPSRVIRRY